MGWDLLDSGASVVGKAVHTLENGGASSSLVMPEGRGMSGRGFASKSGSRDDHKRLLWTTVPIRQATGSTARRYPYADPNPAARSGLLPHRASIGETARRAVEDALTICCLSTPKGPARGRFARAIRKRLAHPEIRTLATHVRGLVESIWPC